MRQNLPRRRVTLDPLPNASRQDWFFLLRPGPITEAFNYWLLVQAAARHALVTMFVVFVPIVFPVSGWTILFFYVPVLGALLIPFVAEVAYATSTVCKVGYLILVASSVRLAFWLAEHFPNFAPTADSSAANEFNPMVGWALAVFVFSPLLMNAASSRSAAQSLELSAIFALMLGIGAGCMISVELPFVPNRFLWCVFAGGLFYGRELISSYSCRLSASPYVAFEASIALGAANRRGTTIKSPSSVIRSSANSPVVQGLIFACWLLGLARLPTTLDEPDHPKLIVAAILFSAAFLASGGLLWRLVLRAKSTLLFSETLQLTITSMLQALALWETDHHPTPYAPGVYTAARLDFGGLPVRRTLTWALVVLMFFAVAFREGRREFASLAVSLLSTPLYDLPFRLMAMFAFVEVALVLGVTLAFGPAALEARFVAEGSIRPGVSR